jgi:hypothetical protein
MLNKTLLIPLVTIVVLSSCDHNVTSETTVYPDGRLDKIFVFGNSDSLKNIVGIAESNGWHKTVVNQNDKTTKLKSDNKFITTYRKSFESAAEANEELSSKCDSLLRITSTFEKSFGWFYTYIRYSETVHSANNLRLMPDDFLVKEDYAFIDRLPAEGKSMSKADAFYLSELNNRIFDKYGARALFEECYDMSKSILHQQKLEGKWFDTLDAHKEDLFLKIQKSGDIGNNVVRDALDSLGLPLDTAGFRKSFDLSLKVLEKRTNFISSASEGKYKYIVHLPWELVSSNADSTAGNTVVWSPPSIRFLLKDYTMYSECRKPNYIIWILSGAILLFTAYLFTRRRGA